MRVAVFGGSRGVGAQVLPQAVDRMWGVKVLSRSASAIPETPGVQVEEGDVLDPGAVFRTLDGCDAAVIALGKAKGTSDTVRSEGTAIITQVMEKLSVPRVVAVSAMGVGDSADQVPFLFKLLAKSVLRKAMYDHEAQEQILRGSNLDWVVVRPAGLTDKPFSGYYQCGVDRSAIAGRVSRADVASFVLDQISDDRFLRQAPYITG